MVRGNRLPVVLAVLGLVLVDRSAQAFDSSGADLGTSTHSPRIPLSFPFGGNYRSGSLVSFDPFHDALGTPGPGLHYVARYSHHSLGAPAEESLESAAVAGLMHCPAEAFQSEKLDLAACVPFRRNDWAETNAGWIKVRRAWHREPAADRAKDGANPEHMMIVLDAATRAGFDTTTLLSSPTFLRYPTRDAWVRSRVTPEVAGAPLDGNVDTVVGQSWVPTAWSQAGASAVRPVYLPELAQMPDVTTSVWDWAAGAEKCAVKGIQNDGVSAFGDARFDANGCHDYMRVLGPVNASHFLPLARDYWRHYHQLALQRMSACKTLSTALAPLYADIDAYYVGLGKFERFRAKGDDEAHECEREAFVYEMFAQHYLADAWATGHMWKRWGHTDLSDFRVDLPGTTPLEAPENLPAYRFEVAGVTALYAGMLHGAKGALAPAFRDVAKAKGLKAMAAKTAVWVAGGEVFDDPLSAPYYHDVIAERLSSITLGDAVVDRTTWTDGLSGHPGVGDLYYRPARFSGGPSSKYPMVRLGDESTPLTEQRARLLDCAGASLREVYLAGPGAHGTLGAATCATGSISPASDTCWNHWANNASMAGALGPFLLARKYRLDPDTHEPVPADLETRAVESFFATANDLVVDKVSSSTSFANESKGLEYSKRLLETLQRSHMELMTDLTINAHDAKDGTDSAQLADANLGVPFDPFLYVVPANQGFVGGVPKSDHGLDRATPRDSVESDHYVRRMFWRSHLGETCRDALAIDPATSKSTIATLRDRCVAAAPHGGDPEACTACVELAELHIPHVRLTDKDLPSRCDALSGAPWDKSSLPPEFFSSTKKSLPDFLDKLAQNHLLAGAPPWWTAVSYCTDTAYTPETKGVGNDLQKDLGTDTSEARVSACDREGTGGFSTSTGSLTRRCTEDGCECLDTESGDEFPAWVDCSTLVDYRPVNVHFKRRNAVIHLESDGFDVTPSAIVSAVDVRYTVKEAVRTDPSGDLRCHLGFEDDTGVPSSALVSDINTASLPTTDAAPFNPSFVGKGHSLMLASCGQVQRFSWWDSTCSSVASKFPAIFPEGWSPGWNPSNGFLANSNTGWDGTPRCELIEPRTISGACPKSTSCGSGGLCRAAPLGGMLFSAPPVYFLDDVPLRDPDGICQVSRQGGPYESLCKQLGVIEAHHLPSTASWTYANWPLKLTSSGKYVNRNTAPAIRVTYTDHKCTRSWGSNDPAFRKHIGALIAAGKFREALDEEIADVRRCAGTKYDPAIAEMQSYLRTEGLL